METHQTFNPWGHSDHRGEPPSKAQQKANLDAEVARLARLCATHEARDIITHWKMGRAVSGLLNESTQVSPAQPGSVDTKSLAKPTWTLKSIAKKLGKRVPEVEFAMRMFENVPARSIARMCRLNRRYGEKIYTLEGLKVALKLSSRSRFTEAVNRVTREPRSLKNVAREMLRDEKQRHRPE